MTASTANLTDILMSAKIDLLELDIFLIDYFGHASQISENSFLYGKKESNTHLTLTYSKNHKSLDDISFGKNWTREELSKIQKRINEAFFDEMPRSIGQTVLFSRYPVEGYYFISEFLQLRPAPPSAPRPRFSYADHPFLFTHMTGG